MEYCSSQYLKSTFFQLFNTLKIRKYVLCINNKHMRNDMNDLDVESYNSKLSLKTII